MSAVMAESSVAHLRVPPQAIDAEQNVLGALLLVPTAFARVADLLTEQDFYRRDHQLIYRAICDLNAAGKGETADWCVVGDWFVAMGLSEQVANGAYLVELSSNTASAANVRAYAEIVRDRSIQRQLIDIGTETVNAGFDPNGRDTSELLALAAQRINALSGNAKVGGPVDMRTVAGEWFEKLQRRADGADAALGLLTPWGDFNRITSGLHPGDLMILAGRPSMGKSAVAINLSVAAALAGKRGMYFSLEMTSASIFNRGVAALGNVPLKWLRKPEDCDESDAYWPRVSGAVTQLRNAPLLLDETPAITQQMIEARAMREHQRKPLDFIVVDHIHLIPLPGKTKEATEVGHISATLKSVAKRLNVPVIALAQLNRSVESRPDKRPRMSDLRESGAIEQDADLIVFVYRDDYYAQQENRTSNAPEVVELVVAKQREGETGSVYLRNRLGFGRVDEFPDYQPTPISNAKPTTGWGKERATQ